MSTLQRKADTMLDQASVNVAEELHISVAKSVKMEMQEAKNTVRIRKAGAAFGKIKHIKGDKSLSLKTKGVIYSALVISILLYGCET